MPRKQTQQLYVTTRKPHKCASCGETILKGTRVAIHHAFTGKTEYYHPWPNGCPKFNER